MMNAPRRLSVASLGVLAAGLLAEKKIPVIYGHIFTQPASDSASFSQSQRT